MLLASAIARPESFEEGVGRLDLEIAGHLRFPDHHPYPDESLARLAAAFRESGAAAILGTSKDLVKLAGRLGEAIPLAELPLVAEPETAMWKWLDGRV